MSLVLFFFLLKAAVANPKLSAGDNTNVMCGCIWVIFRLIFEGLVTYSPCFSPCSRMVQYFARYSLRHVQSLAVETEFANSFPDNKVIL